MSTQKNRVYIRPLKIEDASVSYKWRNDVLVWEFTGNRPTKFITQDMEEKWLKGKLKNKNEKRFAICLSENDEYIGNIQLLNLSDACGEFHIFIGNREAWGKGFAFEASELLISRAFEEFGLYFIYLNVNHKHKKGIALYEKLGFKIIGQIGENNLMILLSE